jgi:urea transporter
VAGRVSDGPLAAARGALDGLLRSYGQVLFSRSRRVGALLLLATMLVPRVGLSGLATGVLALITARLLGLPATQRAEGLYTYNAVLIGLGVGALFPAGPVTAGLLVASAVLGVVLAAALQGALTARTGLPQLSIAFQLGLWVVAAAAPTAGVQATPADALPLLHMPAPNLVLRSLEALGALFFVPRWDAGLLVLLALAVHSRIAAGLAILGIAATGPFAAATAGTWATALHGTLAFNLALTAVALGGTWFVPGGASVLLALAGCLVAALLTFGLAQPLLATGLPVRVLPFNITVLLVLLAMRLRERDGSPKAVDWLLGTPEENLRTWRTRVARFGATYLARFHTPFRGRWTVTQGTDGAHTHQGPWRHAADFEVLGPDTTPATGPTNADHRCWRLPVVACADATVARVLDGAPDLPAGDVDLHDNWGNVVVLWHGGRVWSMVGHLASGSVTVREGQVVKQGEPLGLCGSSGRSPRPHLHFQLQGAPEPGAPTLPLELHDAVRQTPDGDELVASATPAAGETWRAIEPQADVAALLRFRPDEPLRFTVRGPGGERTETLTPAVSPVGALQLRSDDGATLFYATSPRLFVVLDVLGERGSTLDLLRLALPRMPLEVSARLSWTDHVPAAWLGPRLVQRVLAPVWPLGAGRGQAMRYRARREGSGVVVEGQSHATRSDGSPRLRTQVVLSADHGLESIEVVAGGRTRTAHRQPTA